jgi:hypothetical protein
MHFLFNLLRIKSLYIFQALLSHPQEALKKRSIPSAVCEAPPEDEQVMLKLVDALNSQYIEQKVHHVGVIILLSYDAQSTKQ